MGWDVTPHCEHNVPFPFAKPKYPYGPVVVGNTPERFGDCASCRRLCGQRPKHPPAIFVNAWNEWTEGSYLLPEEKNGTAYLKSLETSLRSVTPEPVLLVLGTAMFTATTTASPLLAMTDITASSSRSSSLRRSTSSSKSSAKRG